MTLITTFEDYLKGAEELADNSRWIKIITFGIHESESIQKFFETYKDKKIDVIISYYFKECHPGCEHCIKKSQGAKAHYNKLIDHHPNINFRFITESHAKLFITENGAIIGGMNFSESEWDDFTIVISNINPHYHKLVDYFTNLQLSHSFLTSFEGIGDNIIDFGKYKGYTLQEVLNSDKPYLRWLYVNVEGFKEKFGIKKSDLWSKTS